MGGNTSDFTLVKGMKIRLLVAPGATPWWHGVGGLMSRSWRMPVWIRHEETGQELRLAMNVRELTRAVKKYPLMGKEDQVKERYVPSTPVHRFMFSVMAAHATLRDPSVRRVLACAAQQAEKEMPVGKEIIDELLSSELASTLSSSVSRGRRINNEEEVFNRIRRSLRFDSMLRLPSSSELAEAAAKWLRSNASCEEGLVCGQMNDFSGFAKVELGTGECKKTVYTDIESILYKVEKSLEGNHGCGVEKPEMLAKAMQRLVGPAEFVNLPFLWLPAYRKRGVGPLAHIRFLRKATKESEVYREMIEWFSVVALFAIRELVRVKLEAETPNGRKGLLPYQGVVARLAEAFLAYRFWSGESWERGMENLSEGAKLLDSILSDESKFILQERNAAHGGGVMTRAVVLLARKPLPNWYRWSPNENDAFLREVGEVFEDAEGVLNDSGLSRGGGK